MESTQPTNVLLFIEKIITMIRSNTYEFSEMRNKSHEVNCLTNLLGINTTELAIFCLIVESTILQDLISANDFLKMYDNKISKMKWVNDALDVLIKKGFIVSVQGERQFRNQHKKGYKVAENMYAVLMSNDFSKLEQSQVSTFTEFVNRIGELLAQRSEDDFDAQTFLMLFRREYYAPAKIKELEWIRAFGLTDYEALMYFILISFFLEKHEGADLDYLITEVESNRAKQKTMRNKVLNGSSGLIKNELLYLEECDLVLDEYVRLSEKSIKALFPEQLKLSKKKIFDTASTLESMDIKEESLFYNSKEREQIQTLYEVLQPTFYDVLTQKLREHHMAEGVCILFDGYSGTGKTATAHQLAKATSRALFHVNTEKITDKWLGNTEKNVKKIFDEYRDFSQKCDQTPILLFNEDSIFSNRVQVSASIDRTHNSMQNLLLEQMENFQGIMIVTTNAADRWDKAFERRFLYRVFFDKPSTSTQFAIMSKAFPEFNPVALQSLLQRYPLNGGQISNVRKKYFIQSIISSSKTSVELLEKICLEEVGQKTNLKLGFLN